MADRLSPSEQDKCPTGTVTLDIDIRDYEVPVEDIICHWTKDEVAALIAGDPEAREELISGAMRGIRQMADLEIVEAAIEIEGKRI